MVVFIESYKSTNSNNDSHYRQWETLQRIYKIWHCHQFEKSRSANCWKWVNIENAPPSASVKRKENFVQWKRNSGVERGEVNSALERFS